MQRGERESTGEIHGKKKLSDLIREGGYAGSDI
jgi:hypothetical protein